MKSGKKYKTLAADQGMGAAPFVFAVLFFFVTCLVSIGSVKGVALCLAVVALVLGVVRFSRLRQRVGAPFLALALFVLMAWISTLYAVSGKFALNEFVKIFAAFCVALILLAAAPEKDGGRKIAVILSGGTALAGLVSIDMFSTQLISGAVRGVLRMFTEDYVSMNAVEAGVRMTSIYTNPNVFAGCVGLGVLLALSLVQSAKGSKERCACLCLLFLNSLAFVLAFSMGATGMICVAFLIYLLLEYSNRRSALLVLMLETLILAAAATALISMTSLDGADQFRIVPLLCAVVGCVVLCLLDRYVGQKVGELLRERGKLIWVALGVILVAILVFALVAYSWTGGAALQQGESLRRSVYPAPGEYTVSAQCDAPVTVTVESQNQQDAMMHTSTVLYSGALDGAQFTVPEDSRVVYFSFGAEQNVWLEAVTLTGAQEEVSVPLGYKLLPGFIANRLQGLFANQNAIQRTVFFADGMKLFRHNPVVGLGLGAFETKIKSVQSFYYETKYVHNHYIQVLLENGVIGLLLFLGVLGVSAVALVRVRRKNDEKDTLIPALAAALVFMAGHAAVEVIFSYHAYLPMAFGIFALINLCCADAFALTRLGKVGRSVVLGAKAALIVVFSVMLCANMLARTVVDNNPTMASLERSIAMDPYEKGDYMLSYVISAPLFEEDAVIMMKADEFAQRLSEVDSNTVPIYLAEYYFTTDRPEQAVAMVKKYVTYVASDSDAWNAGFALMDDYYCDDSAYLNGAREIFALLDSWNENNMGAIALDENAQSFREKIEQSS